MPIDFRNQNTIWASVIAETLARLGLNTVIICPGSRSAPLAIAFAQHPNIHALSILDERSAAFFALGHAQRSHQPVVLVCTSGTAGANFYPALIEAHESRVPLLVLTADRPPELRHCHAGQAIDQVKLFGHFPRWYTELALPEAHLSQLAYLRQTLNYGWEKSLWPVPGPVHLNCPFRDPLVPVEDSSSGSMQAHWNEDLFFQSIHPKTFPTGHIPPEDIPWKDWQNCDRGLIIAGPANPQNPQAYCEALAHLATSLNWPVLAEGLSPLRNFAALNPNLIASYAIALKHPTLQTQLKPTQIIRIGELPISKELRQWLSHLESPQWIVDPCDQNLDAIHSSSQSLRISIETLVAHLPRIEKSDRPSTYLRQWIQIEEHLQHVIHLSLSQCPDLWESKVAWMLAQHLPPQTPLFVSNSMPVRDVEWFWPKNNRHIQPYFNRGANGIDGITSSAFGMAFQQQPSVLLTGDLAFLHDTNGLLPNSRWQGHLTIVVINNNGGGIFEMLPIAQYNPPFEEFFATPQTVEIQILCQAYGIAYQRIQSWDEFQAKIQTLPSRGVRVLEVRCDRHKDSATRKTMFANWLTSIPSHPSAP